MKILYAHPVPLDEKKANVLQALQMCRAFSELGHEVNLIVPSGKVLKNPEESAITRLGIDKINFKIFTYKRASILGRCKRLCSILPCLRFAKNGKFDCVFSRNHIITLFFIFSGYNVIFESHFHYGKKFQKILLKIHNKIVIKISKSFYCKVFVAISDNLKNYWLKKGVPLDKIIVAHDGVDLSMFNKAFSLQNSRKELGLPLDKKVVVYSGSLSGDRNVKQILKLAKEFSQLQFIIMGGEEKEQQIYKEYTNSLYITNVEFTGYLPQSRVVQYLLSADILLMLWSKAVPTINYCSPLKLFEYMAAGRIIVGHRFPTIDEVIEDGVHAYLVEPDSFVLLKNTFSKAINDTYPNNMAAKAQELSRKYTWQSRAQKIIDFYNTKIGQENT